MKLATFLLALPLLAQTAPTAIRCAPGAGSTALLVPVASGVLTTTCIQLDAKVFTMDNTTTPPTLRSVINAPAPVNAAQPQATRETPIGVIDGKNATFTLSAGPSGTWPVLVFRNGLLLQPCNAGGLCNGDYQQSGNTILFLSAAQTTSGVSAIPQPGDLLTAVYWR